MESTAMSVAALAGCGVVLAVLLYGLTGMLLCRPPRQSATVATTADRPSVQAH
jgi:hypothetical protein